MSDQDPNSVTFDSLGLHPALMAGIRDAGFTQCTPIQAQTLPRALEGHDMAGQAQTGTGKTAAFLVALYQALLRNPPPSSRQKSSIRALVVARPASLRYRSITTRRSSDGIRA